MIDVRKLENYEQINIPVDNYFNVDYSIDGSNYNITLKYDDIMRCWYIKIKTGDIDTGFNKLTQNIRCFLSYRNKMKHCFFTTTTSTLMPMSEQSFSQLGDTYLYCTTWEDYDKNILNAEE